MTKVISIEVRNEKIKNATKDAQIEAAESELNKVIGAIHGWQNGTVHVDAVDLLDLIKEDILDYFRRGEKP